MVIKAMGQISLTDMNDIVSQTTAPTSPVQGMMWFNTTNNQLYVYISGAWVVSTAGMQIGGRNLLTNSGNFSDTTGWGVYTGAYPITGIEVLDNPIYGKVLTATGDTALARLKVGGNHSMEGKNRKLMFSMVYSQTGTDPVTFGGKYSTLTTGGVEYSAFTGSNVVYQDLGNGFKRMTCEVNLTYTAGYEGFFCYIYTRVNTITVANCQLEEGNVVTNWTPATEDAEKVVSDLGDKVGGIDDRTSVTALIDTVVFSEDFTSILSNKANSEDLSGLATGEELTGVQTTVTQYVDGRIDGDGGVNEAINAVSSSLTKTANEINAKFSSSGGINLVKNSIGYVGKDFWSISGVVNTVQNQELEQLGFGSGFETKVGAGGYIEQTIPTTVGGDYSLSFWLKKTIDNATTGDAGVEVYANGVKLAFIGKAKGAGITSGLNKYELGTYSFKTDFSEITVRITCGAGAEAIISGLMLNVGTVPLQWQHANGEIYNTNVQMNLNGIKVISSAYAGYTIMSPQEFSGYAEVLDANNQPVMTKVFTLNQDTTEVTKIQIDKEINMSPVKAIPIVSATSNGWAFIATE